MKLLSLSHPDLTVPSRFRGTIASMICSLTQLGEKCLAYSIQLLLNGIEVCQH